MASTWRPFYLRPTVLICYGIILVLLIATLESLLAISIKGHGLATGHDEFRYLWTYGPTAFLTLLTAIWSRVTFQAQSVTPWYRISGGSRADIKKALLLDYTSMFQPVGIFKSLRNHDWIVGITISGLLVSQLAVALSTGLFQIDWENLDLDSVPIVLETSFSNDSRTVEPLSTLDHYATLETFDGSAQFRRGTTGGFAYQTFDSQLGEVAELRTTVDGFTAGMTCEPASLSVTNIDYNNSSLAKFSTALESYPCHIGWNLILDLFPYNLVGESVGYEYPGRTSEKYISRLINGECDSGSDLENKRTGLLFGTVKYSYGPFKESNFSLLSVEMEASTQIFCKPTYQIARLDLVQNGTNEPFITRSDNSTMLPYIHPWDIMEAMLATQNLLIPDDVTPAKQLFPDFEADVDNFTANLLQASGAPPRESLIMPQFLIAILSQYCRVFTAQIASLSLMHSVSEPSTASAKVRSYRLTVNYAVCQELLGLSSLLLVCCAATIILQWKKLPLPQRTNHIVGIAKACASNTAITDTVCWSNSPELERPESLDIEMDSPCFGDTATLETVRLRIKDETLDMDRKLDIGTIIPQLYFKAPGTSPTVLRLWIVGPTVTLLIAIIAGLETSLQLSQKNQRFCKIDDDPYVRYGLTIIPALIIGLIALYYGSVDYESRTLAPYWLMASRAGSTKSLRLDLLNSAIPRIIWSEIRSKSYVNLAITVATLVASLFTTFTSPLLSGIVTSQMSGIQLRINETLRTDPPYQILNGPDKIRSSLILRANWTYPPNTYEDLVFVGTAIKESKATLQSNNTLGSSSIQHSRNDTEALIHATIPALRARLDCRFPKFHIRPIDKWFRLIVDGEGDGRLFTFMPEDVSTSGSNFGMTTWADSSMIYAWGQAFNLTGGEYSVNATVMACNESIQAVDVQTVFYARNQSIYQDTLPKPNEATMRVSSATYLYNKFGDIYEGLLSTNNFGPLMAPFFELLTVSRQGVSFEELGDVSKAPKVEEAIRFQHGIIRAQFADSNMRYSLGETNNALPDRYPPSDERNYGVLYDAQLEIPKAQFCIIQDAAATRILESLIGAVVVLVSISKLFERRTDILPRNPRSIASVLALIAGGNLSQILQSKNGGAKEDSSESAKQGLFADGRVCWLGWRKVKESEGGEAARYGIWVLTPQEVEEVEKMQKQEAGAIKRNRRQKWRGLFRR